MNPTSASTTLWGKVDQGLDMLTHWLLGDFKEILVFKLILVIDGWSIYCKIVLKWMPIDLTDDGKSTLVQVMAWCHQATTITWANVDPDLCRQFSVAVRYKKSISIIETVISIDYRYYRLLGILF